MEGGAAYAPSNQDVTGRQQPGHGLTGGDKQQGSLRSAKGDPSDRIPEGLRRERTHPLSPTEGRGNDKDAIIDPK